MIIAASRRTDIPAFYSEWFMNRIREGYVMTRNPMNPTQLSRISLEPSVIDCIVFWTKDPLPMLDKLPELDEKGYRYYFQFTLNPYGNDLEQNLRSKNEILHTFHRLVEGIGRDKVLWRYDPIIINDSLTIEYHKERFSFLCSRLSDDTKLCTISFVDLYSKLKKPIKKGLIREISAVERYELAAEFYAIARKYGISLRACCENSDLRRLGIESASCIDKELIERICGYRIRAKADTGQRPGCGCIQSIDIGGYNTCRNGCVYCYANYSSTSVEKNFCSHNPRSELLTGTVRSEETIRNREMKLLKIEK